MPASNQCFHQKLFYFCNADVKTKIKKKNKKKKLHLHSKVHKNRHQKKSQEPKIFPDPSHRSVWKPPVAKCQTAHKPFLQHSNDEPKSGIPAAWKKQFSFITTQPHVQHFSTTQYNFSFHRGEDSECVCFYCSRSYEGKQKGFLTWGDTRGITNSTWQATTAELGGTLHFCGAVAGWQEPRLGVLVMWGGFTKHKGNGPRHQTKVTEHELG